MNIHKTAIVDPAAELHDSVVIGPYTIIEKGVRIGQESIVGPHALISGRTTIGKRNQIGAFTTIGMPPQDIKYQGEETGLFIGNDNKIREYVSIHRGTPDGRGVTTVGSDNLLMAYVHVAHDCLIADHIIMANGVTLGGHVEIDERASLGGLTAVHQFSRIGAYAYIGGMSGISKDVPPYVIVTGMRNQMRVTGINKIGLERCDFSHDVIRKLVKAYKIIFRTPNLLLEDALTTTLSEITDCPPVTQLVRFFRDSTRGVVRVSCDEG